MEKLQELRDIAFKFSSAMTGVTEKAARLKSWQLGPGEDFIIQIKAQVDFLVWLYSVHHL